MAGALVVADRSRVILEPRHLLHQFRHLLRADRFGHVVVEAGLFGQAAILLLAGFQMFLTGIVADLIATNRAIIEDTATRVRAMELEARATMPAELPAELPDKKPADRL